MTKGTRFLSIFFLLVAALLFSSCGKEDKITFGDSFTLKKTGQIIFSLDSMTKTEHAVVNFSQQLNSLCVFNEINHSIYFFDVSTQETTKIIPIEKEGPNGVGRVKAMLVHTRDSVFLFNDATNKVVLMNNKAEVLERFELFNRAAGDPARILEPEIYFHDGNLYLMGRAASFTDKDKNKNIVKYNIKEADKSFLMDYPTSYQQGKWSSKIMNKFALFNSDSGDFIVSFPFDPFIHVFNERMDETKAYYAGSDLMKQPKQITAKEKSNVANYLLSNSWYWRLFYDPYNKIHLRSASVGYDMENTDLSSQTYKSKNRDGIFNTTIILNEDLEKMGEVPGLNFYKATFSTREGIYIQDFDTDSDNEDVMVFSKYQLVKK